MKIPFNRLYLTGTEYEYLRESLESGTVAGDGPFDQKVCAELENRLSLKKVITTTSGTHALELAMALADIREGDQVVMPSFTFPSTANAVLLRGAVPVFCEVDETTLCMDLSDVKKRITPQTKALLPVHYGGICCPMDRLVSLAADQGLVVIEDAAQALGSTYLGKSLGSWGTFGCFSFHATKNLISGEGGALALNTEDSLLLERAEVYRQKGTNRMQFVKGEVNQYTWVDEGSSYAPSDLLMALLYAQLEQMDQIHEKRNRIFACYQRLVEPLVKKGRVQSMSTVPEGVCSNGHNFTVLFHSNQERERVRRQLQKQGIGAVIHFVPLHESPMGKKLGYEPEDLPVTKGVGECLLRLPLFTGMLEEEVEQVVNALTRTLEAGHGR